MTLQDHKDWLISLLATMAPSDGSGFGQVTRIREGALFFGMYIPFDEYLVKYAKAIKAMEAKLTEENVV